MAEFETGFPSVRQLQQWTADKQTIEVKVVTGDTITGSILWQDVHCLCLTESSGQQTVIWRQAIAYHRALATS
ncbi:Hfq-related RNA-binding protein [Spirulina major]|jgi:host factor-I protein|uniref:Hfq-related RNA-binding protein n=1 Tax=Spirulina major TaxID=270636 RepID=UPI000934F5EA|nr:RNA chaperone Hfq [Spirulina major]